jgi:hypothetical protein
MDVRLADATELDALTMIWLDGWRDAHAHLVPRDLAALCLEVWVARSRCTRNAEKTCR